MARRTRLWTAVFIAALTLAGTAASAEAAAPPEWDVLAADIARPWPGLIGPEGRFPDYVQQDSSHDTTASPMLGYALIQTGLRHGDQAQIETGLKALNSAVRDIHRAAGPGVFDHFAIASAYNLCRERLADHPLFAPHKGEWADWLRRIDLKWLPATGHYANKYLVEAVAVLEMRRSGLRSRVKGSAMAQGRHAEHLARRLVNVVAPREARVAATQFKGGAALVLSDPSNNALAYHALSFGFLGRAVELLGPGASPAARQALQGVARASWGLQAPDGDLAYIGRSQGMAWTLSLSGYGAEVAAGQGDGWAPRYRAVSTLALARLSTHYGTGPLGMWITPSRGAGAGEASGDLDVYANAPGYAGLTLIGLNWAIEHAERHERTVGAIAADTPGARPLASRRTAFTVVRSGASWFAVRTSRSFSGRDLRYDMGLVALKRSAPGGGWVDVVRARPHTSTGADSAGPVLSTPQGVALPDAERANVDEAGTVTLRGGYRSRDGRWLRRGVSFRYGPVPCGVQIVLPRRPTDRLSYSFWFTEAPAREGNTLISPHAAVTASPSFTVRLRESGGSAVDGRLVRADLRFRRGRGDVRITICGR